MALTFYQDFLRDDGSPVTVEYSIRELGGGCEINIVDAMPNTPEFEALCGQSLEFCRESGNWAPDSNPFDAEIKVAKAAIELTADECDRMVAWLAEHHAH